MDEQMLGAIPTLGDGVWGEKERGRAVIVDNKRELDGPEGREARAGEF